MNARYYTGVCWTPDGAQTRAQTSRETGGAATYLDLSPFGRSVVDQLTSIR